MLLNVMGGLGTAYKGYMAGRDDQRGREVKDALSDQRKRQVADEEALAPLQQRASIAKAEADIANMEEAEDLRPIARDVRMRTAKAEQGMLDDKLALEKGRVDEALRAQTVKTILSAADAPEARETANSKLLALAGKQVASGNMNGITQIVGDIIDSPLIPAWKDLGKPVNTTMSDAPEGAVDMMTGQPVKGKALKITFDNGSSQWIHPDQMVNAYSQQLASQRKTISTSPGQILIDPVTGREVFRNENFAPNRWNQVDENGNPVVMGGGLGGGGGSGGRGANGKPLPGSPEARRQDGADAWESILKNSDIKLPPNVNAEGATLVEKFMVENPSMPASVAANVALKVAQDPKLAEPAIDVKTGRINTVYTNKSYGDFVVDRDIQDANPEQMKNAVKKLLATEPKLQKAAFDDAARDAMIKADLAELESEAQKRIKANPASADAIRSAIDKVKGEYADALTRKLAIIKQHGSAPKDEKAKGDRKTGGWGAVMGGLGAPVQHDPNSPAGRAAARREKAREDQAEKDRVKAEEAETASILFNKDKQSMSPLELVRKYDARRGSMSAKDAAELRRIERTL